MDNLIYQVVLTYPMPLRLTGSLLVDLVEITAAATVELIVMR